MGFNGLVLSGLCYGAAEPASDFPGIAGTRSQNTRFTHSKRVKARRRARAQQIEANANANGEARQAERTRIAQEVHDTLLQGFCSVSMQLEAAVDRLPADSAAKPRFYAVVRLVHRVLEEGRLAVMGLRSPRETGPSLSQAFAAVPDELGLEPAIRFRVVVAGRQRELTASLWDEVYRIGREAIVNAYRHSGAREIEVQIEYRPAELRVSVHDNGCGINPQQLKCARAGHWGLQGMRERADRIGARLRVWTRVALGTEVELCVPGSVAFEEGIAPTA